MIMRRGFDSIRGSSNAHALSRLSWIYYQTGTEYSDDFYNSWVEDIIAVDIENRTRRCDIATKGWCMSHMTGWTNHIAIFLETQRCWELCPTGVLKIFEKTIMVIATGTSLVHRLWLVVPFTAARVGTQESTYHSGGTFNKAGGLNL